ncbi:RNA polymerase subunit sigma-70 [Pseudonocardia thermophila]|jgi:RNA polymerase sigma-70 factor, TIGR02960 family|uniref:RNA polymerase subunit sigma-70 n=1 Tax=Pseudonocardia thermophila TaxID=1848 RepID=UPI00248F461D|nr:RNA polymerase subunit sigma-70 [Pseudonocardia thermophila]
MADVRRTSADEPAFLAAVRSADATRFAALTERYRRDLMVHCYRLVANYDDAQDLTQETFLRAWHKRGSFRGNAALRTWLHRIATNACLDFLEEKAERTPTPAEPGGAIFEVPHLQPFPDRMLPADPADSVVARETIELAFVAAVQHLPPRQRAAFILRDVLGWPAATTASALGLTVASVTSAVQRARVTLRAHLPGRRSDWHTPTTHELSEVERAVLRSYIEAHERNDLDGLASLLRADLRFTMLPEPGTVVTSAKDAVAGWVAGGLFSRYCDLRGVPTTVNLMPTAALYLRSPGHPSHRLWNIAVLHVVGGKIAELTGFAAADTPWLGLPAEL